MALKARIASPQKQTTEEQPTRQQNAASPRVNNSTERPRHEFWSKSSVIIFLAFLALFIVERPDVVENYNVESNISTMSPIRPFSEILSESRTSVPVRQRSSARKTKETTTLPEALSNVTFDGSCMGYNTSVCKGGIGKFQATCYTEKACNNTIFPFSSQQEADYYAMWNPARNVKRYHKEKCRIDNEKLPPPPQWCGRSFYNYTKDVYRSGCSRDHMGISSGPFDRVYLVPSAKLFFCGIPKVGVSRWMRFFRFAFGAKDYDILPYWKRDMEKFRLDVLKPEVRKKILLDSSWKRVVMIRHPAERVLSAYLDKIQGAPKKHPNVTFSDFIDQIAETGPYYWAMDPHWRSQALSCGLSETLHRFDYVGTLDRAAQHSKAILELVDMWESYGKHYRTSPFDDPGPGFQQESSQGDKHDKGSQHQFEEYYTKELMARVESLYSWDFALWDAAQKAAKENKVAGREIAAILNPRCNAGQ